jgi:putative hydrolase
MNDLLRGDYHVHSQFSDDATSTVAENISAAASVGLTELRLIDHVRASTTWVPEFLAVIAAEQPVEGLAVLTGVETKILNSRGDLDVPPGLVVGRGGVDTIVIADHQFPGVDGPWSPEATIRKFADGLSTADALDILIGALVGAMESVAERGVDGAGQLAHCFSILPKIGLSEADLTDEHLRTWASTAARTGTLIEVNEKWTCPGPRSIRAAHDAGVRLVASTDSHVANDVGRYEVVPRLLEAAGL